MSCVVRGVCVCVRVYIGVRVYVRVWFFALKNLVTRSSTLGS